MGIVAIATHLQLDQRVALKVLHERLASDRIVVERLVREARAVAKLKNEHVCRVSDVGQLASGAPYVVMELLDGRDLAHAIAERPLEQPVAVDHVVQACVALAEAHAHGIVHRDLKPANLFVTRRLDGSLLVKVLDFGIAKAPDDGAQTVLTQTDTVMGTPGYMAPEQLRSTRDVDARADIWALGVVLYQAISGRLPFPGTTLTEIALKIAMDPPDPIDVAPGLDAVIARCLDKEPAGRFAGVGELADALVPFGGESSREYAALARKLRGAHADTMPASTGPAPGSSTTLESAAAIVPVPTRPRAVRWPMLAGLAGAGVAAALVFAWPRGNSGAIAVAHDAASDGDLVAATEAACERGDAAAARGYARKLSASDRRRAQDACLPASIDLSAPDAPELKERFAAAIAKHECGKATSLSHQLDASGEVTSQLAACDRGRALVGVDPTRPDAEDWEQGIVGDLEHGGNARDVPGVLAEFYELRAAAFCQKHDVAAARVALDKVTDAGAKTQVRAQCKAAHVALDTPQPVRPAAPAKVAQPTPAPAVSPQPTKAATQPAPTPVAFRAEIAANHCDRAGMIVKAIGDAHPELVAPLHDCTMSRAHAISNMGVPSAEPIILAYAEELELDGNGAGASGMRSTLYSVRANVACKANDAAAARVAFAKVLAGNRDAVIAACKQAGVTL